MSPATLKERAAYAREAGAAKRAERSKRDALVHAALELARQRLPDAVEVMHHAWKDDLPVIAVRHREGEAFRVYLYRPETKDYGSGYDRTPTPTERNDDGNTGENSGTPAPISAGPTPGSQAPKRRRRSARSRRRRGRAEARAAKKASS